MIYPADYPSHWKKRSKVDEGFSVCLNSAGTKIWVKIPGGGFVFTIDRDKLADLISKLKPFLQN